MVGGAAGGAGRPCTLEQLEALLAECAAAGRPPMVVANPDYVTTSGAALVVMPGHLGRVYAGMGGQARPAPPPPPLPP